MSKIKFIIFGQGRSGSTLLKQLLDSHPEITCEGELLNPEDNYLTNPLLIKIVNKFPIQFFTLRCFFSKKPVYGFTLLFYWCPFPGKTLGILEKKGWKIILTYRKNVVDQALSHLVARNTNFWHRLPGKPAPEINKIYIAPPQFLDRVKTIYRVRKRENEIMKNFEHLRVVYESDLQHQENWDETAHRIFDYLGVNPAPLAASIKRTYDKPYSEIIENYDELVSALQKNNLPTSI